MTKKELLKKKLELTKEKLEEQGYVLGEQGDLMFNLPTMKQYEYAFQADIEDVWPDNAWWELTEYWDIFQESIMAGKLANEVISDILEHIENDEEATSEQIAELEKTEEETEEEIDDELHVDESLTEGNAGDIYKVTLYDNQNNEEVVVGVIANSEKEAENIAEKYFIDDYLSEVDDEVSEEELIDGWHELHYVSAEKSSREQLEQESIEYDIEIINEELEEDCEDCKVSDSIIKLIDDEGE